MKKILLAGLAAIALSACQKHEIKEGDVCGHTYTPAKEEIMWIPTGDGYIIPLPQKVEEKFSLDVCGYNFDGKYVVDTYEVSKETYDSYRDGEHISFK